MNLTFSHHQQAFWLSLSRLAKKPLGTLLSSLVIAVALSLPAVGYVLLDNSSRLVQGVSAKAEMSIFLKQDVANTQTNALQRRLSADKRIAKVRFIARDDALKRLINSTQLNDLADALGENPLPDAFIIEPKSTEPKIFRALQQEISAWPEVAHVQLDSQWVERLQALIVLARNTVLILGIILGCALVVITFNTIRLQLLTLRHEIAVSLLLGATRSFVRRPFLYYGFLQGMLGGLLALGCVALLINALAPSLQGLANAYNISMNIHGPNVAQAVILTVFAATLGWVGANLSVARNLRDGPAD